MLKWAGIPPFVLRLCSSTYAPDLTIQVRPEAKSSETRLLKSLSLFLSYPDVRHDYPPTQLFPPLSKSQSILFLVRYQSQEWHISRHYLHFFHNLPHLYHYYDI